MTEIETACTYDCPDACGLLAEERDGRLHLRGNPDHPITRGFLCRRIRRHPARLIDPDRVTTPLERSGGAWKPIDWDRALDLAAERLGEALDGYGPASVVHVFSGGSLGVKKELVGHFFHSLGPVTTLRGGVCDETGAAAQRADFGDKAGHDYTDLASTRALVLWGKNPAVTGMHLVPFVREVSGRGAPVILIDIRRTRTAAFADRFIRVVPGGDGFLALAVLRTAYEQGRLDKDAIARCENFDAFEAMLTAPGMQAGELVRRSGARPADAEYLFEVYTTVNPVATHLGWGLQRRAGGGKLVRYVDALGMLTGHVGVAGGGVTYSPWRRRGIDTSFLAGSSGRTLDVPTFGRDLAGLADPPARFVYINGANPVAQFADSNGVFSALGKAGFVMLADAFLTDTADCADLFLPVTLMGEEGGDAVGSFNHHHVCRVRKAIEPPPGVREDVWIVNELNRRLGREDDPLLSRPEETVERMTASWFDDPDRSFARNPTHDPVPYAKSFRTPTGRMHLVTDPPGEIDEVDGYPLLLLTPKPLGFEHSQMKPEEQEQPFVCWVNPGAPGAAQLKEGQVARLASPAGSMEVRVKFDPDLEGNLCVVRVGGWLRFGRAVNALVEPRATDMGYGTAFYDQRVRLEPR